MKSKTMRLSGLFILALLALAIMLSGEGPAQAAGEIGKTIDRSNVQEYKDVLMPALYRAVERGDYILPTGKLDFAYKHWDRFLEAGEKNAGKFDTNAEGDLIDKTGKTPFYNIYGYPFPHVDPKDPKAGEKMMWNFNFMKYRTMCMHWNEYPQWVDLKGMHRFINIESLFMFAQGRPPEHAVPEKENPEHYVNLELSFLLDPYSLRNTNSLEVDFLDGRDIIGLTYVPVIRRIRQTSGVNRSEPFFGGDGWNDLRMQWSGKNRTMTWKLVGERTILVPFTTTKKIMVKMDPDGTFYHTTPPIKYGWETPGWKGVSWAPTSVTWVPREVWIISQMPKDPYYARGLHYNYVDKETYTLWMKEVYDRSGEFRTWVYAMHSYQEGANGQNNTGIVDAQTIVDEKARHAMVSGKRLWPGNEKYYIPLAKRPMSMFTKNYLLQRSK